MFIYCEEKEFEDIVSGNADAVIVVIDHSLDTADSLIGHYAKALNSPFLHDNWDGWLDTICDLMWLPQKYVYLFHKELPNLPEEALDFYVGALIHADSYWSFWLSYDKEEFPAWSSYGLKIYFDNSLRVEVNRMYDRLKDKYTYINDTPPEKMIPFPFGKG